MTKEEAISIISGYEAYGCGYCLQGGEEVEKALRLAVDALRQEIVIRCKDCIYWKRYCRVVDGVTSNHVCGRKRELDGLMHRSKADDFCSWAERKDNDTAD